MGDRELSTVFWLKLHLLVGLWLRLWSLQVFLSLLQNSPPTFLPLSPFLAVVCLISFLESLFHVDYLFSLSNTVRPKEPKVGQNSFHQLGKRFHSCCLTNSLSLEIKSLLERCLGGFHYGKARVKRESFSDPHQEPLVGFKGRVWRSPMTIASLGISHSHTILHSASSNST